MLGKREPMNPVDRANLEDLPQLVQLLAILFSQECEFEPNRSKQDMGLKLLLSSPSHGCIFVFRKEQQIAGMLSLLFTISTAEGGRVCWLEDMVVHPEQRRSGIGTRLLRHAIEFAETEGFLRLTLLTDCANKAARCFYERHGFKASTMTTMRRSLALLV